MCYANQLAQQQVLDMATVMRIVDARWTSLVNLLRVQCSCGHIFEHQADRWVAKCPACGRRESLRKIRENVHFLGKGY